MPILATKLLLKICHFNRKQRKNRNLVTMKFNMINWVLETFSTILVLMKVNRIFYILYLFINATGTPLVYYLGIEENRKAAKEYFRSNIRIFKKPKRVSMATVSTTDESSSFVRPRKSIRPE